MDMQSRNVPLTLSCRGEKGQYVIAQAGHFVRGSVFCGERLFAKDALGGRTEIVEVRIGGKAAHVGGLGTRLQTHMIAPEGIAWDMPPCHEVLLVSVKVFFHETGEWNGLILGRLEKTKPITGEQTARALAAMPTAEALADLAMEEPPTSKKKKEPRSKIGIEHTMELPEITASGGTYREIIEYSQLFFKSERIEATDSHGGNDTFIEAIYLGAEPQLPPGSGPISTTSFLPGVVDNDFLMDTCGPGTPVGFRIYFKNSSTWKGKLIGRAVQ